MTALGFESAVSSLANTQLFNQTASLAKWSSVCLRTKWLSVRIPLQSLNLLPKLHPYFFLFLEEFTPYKTVQPGLVMELHEKEEVVHLGKLITEIQV